MVRNGVAALVCALTQILSAQTWAVTSAASLEPSAALAPASLATGFHSSLRPGTPQTAESPLPVSLAGYSVAIRDSSGAEFAAPLFSAAEGQISFIVPAALAQGDSTFILRAGSSL